MPRLPKVRLRIRHGLSGIAILHADQTLSLQAPYFLQASNNFEGIPAGGDVFDIVLCLGMLARNPANGVEKIHVEANQIQILQRQGRGGDILRLAVQNAGIDYEWS